MLILALAPEASDGLVQVAGPFVPAADVVEVHPAGAVTDWNVVCAGSASPTLTLAAALGPEIGRASGRESVPPGVTGSGEPLLLMDRSALACTVVRAVAVLLSGFESAVELVIMVAVLGSLL